MQTITKANNVPMLTILPMSSIGVTLPTTAASKRPATTVAPQALLFMNSPQVRGYAHALAARLKPATEKSQPDAVTEAYRLVLQRQPSKVESDNAAAFIQKQSTSYQADNKPNGAELALADFCQVLFGLNEFVYIE